LLSTSEYRFKIGDFTPTEPVDPKFQVLGVAPTNCSSSQKTRLNSLSYGINIWTDLPFVLSQFTRLTVRQTDGQTDGQTDRQLSHRYRPRLHSLQRGKNRRCARSVFAKISVEGDVSHLSVVRPMDAPRLCRWQFLHK